jgi:hypothetical protein
VAAVTFATQECEVRWNGRIGGPEMSDGANIIRPLPIEAPLDYREDQNVRIDS